MILEGTQNFFLDIEESKLKELVKKNGKIKNNSEFDEQPLEAKDGYLLYDGEKMTAMTLEYIKERVTDYVVNHNEDEAEYFAMDVLSQITGDLLETHQMFMDGELEDGDEKVKYLETVTQLWMEGKDESRLMSFLDGRFYNEIHPK